MIRIHLKSYNNQLIKLFFSSLKTSKYKRSIKSLIFLPSTYQKFNVKKSPHVNGRSKENYTLKTFSGSCLLYPLRIKDLKFLLLFLKKLSFEGLGISIRIS